MKCFVQSLFAYFFYKGDTFKYVFWVCNKISCCNNEFLGPVIFTGICSNAILFIGDMNSIAPFTSVFFLMSYGVLNVACLMLMWAGAPNFRYCFRFHSLNEAVTRES